MRRMYMQMQIDPRLHNLWLQGCVGVLRAAWACHDAKVADLMQAAAVGEEPEHGNQGEHEDQQDQDNKNSQQVVRNLVSGFCNIVPNRAHGQGAAESAQAQQGGEGGQAAPSAAGLAGEPPVVGGLGQQAGALQEANPTSASASASACHQRIESTMVAQRGTDRANIMDLMGFSDDEVAALQGGASDWGFDVDVDDEEDNGQEAAEVEHEAGYSAELSDYDLSPLSDD